MLHTERLVQLMYSQCKYTVCKTVSVYSGYFLCCHSFLSLSEFLLCWHSKQDEKNVIVRKHWLDLDQGRLIFGTQVFTAPLPAIIYLPVRLNKK